MSIIRNSSAFIPVTNATEIMLYNKTCSHVDNVLFWALNCYAVTISALITNLSLTLIGLFIVILNGVAAHAVLQRDVDDVSDLLIAVLAIADTVVGVFLVYHSVYNLCNWQIFHECMFRYGILLGADLTSVFHLCLLTIDRYMKITWPYLYERIFKKTTVLGLSVSLWIIAMVFGFLPMMGWNYGMPSPTEPQCGFYLILERGYTLLLIFLFLIPFIINAILYGHIFRVAHRHAKSIAEQQTAKSAEKRPSKRTWKFTKTVCLLMGFYFVCWVPTGVFMLLGYCQAVDYMSPEDRGLVVMYLSVLAYINSLVNPIIYAVKIPYIKRRYTQVFGCILCCSCMKNTSQTPVTQFAQSLND